MYNYDGIHVLYWLVDVSSEDEVSLSLSIGEDKQVGSQECSPAHPSMHGSMSTMTSQYLQQLRAAQHSSMDSPSEYQEEKSECYLMIYMYMYMRFHVILRLVTLSIRGETPFALHKL